MAANSSTLLPLKLSTMSLSLESGPVFDCCDQGILQKWHWASFRSSLKRIDTFHLSLWEPWARAVRNLTNLRKRICGEVQRLRCGWGGRGKERQPQETEIWVNPCGPSKPECLPTEYSHVTTVVAICSGKTSQLSTAWIPNAQNHEI